jgi:hypothetical protein
MIFKQSPTYSNLRNRFSNTPLPSSPQMPTNTNVWPQWVINGRPMCITEFATELFGDTPERTMFLLKHSEKPQ